MEFNAPALEYGALAPMLVIFAAAIIAVIVEAFVSAKLRAPLQLAISLGAVVLSFAQVLRLRGTQSATAAVNSVIVMAQFYLCKEQSCSLLSSHS